MDDGSPCFQAARWVIGLGRLCWALLVLAAAWTVLAALFSGAPALLVVPLLLAGWATVWGALLRAFAAHRRGAWQVLVALSAVGALWPAVGWLMGRAPTSWGVVAAAVDLGFLGLLLHRDSREWVGVLEPPGPFVEDSGGRPGAATLKRAPVLIRCRARRDAP
jgi:hypothetical protein